MFNLKTLIRPNIASLNPYDSARSQYIGKSLLMDANENPFGNGKDNRYPDPSQRALREALAKRQNLSPKQIIVGNGSDELIDIIIRTFCEPRKDAVIVCPPTFGMYEASATINDINIQKIPLKNEYKLKVPTIIQSQAKICFLPCPNAPTGNLFATEDLQNILKKFNGIVVLDEAYIDFSDRKSWSKQIKNFPNLIVLQTFSKYWALAGCRVGMAFASPEIITVMNKVKMPYNVNALSAQKALNALKNEPFLRQKSACLRAERERLQKAFQTFDFVKKTFPSQTNFLWIEIKDAQKIKRFLKTKGIIVRGYDDAPNFLRISVGKPSENKKLITTLTTYKS